MYVYKLKGVPEKAGRCARFFSLNTGKPIYYRSYSILENFLSRKDCTFCMSKEFKTGHIHFYIFLELAMQGNICLTCMKDSFYPFVRPIHTNPWPHLESNTK